MTAAGVRPALFLVFLILIPSTAAWAGDCRNLVLETREPAYHIYPNHYGACPDGTKIRCYHYHWDWICEKGEKLYWDRNLQAAALAACGCPMTPGLAQASPFVSDKPPEDIFDGSGTPNPAP